MKSALFPAVLLLLCSLAFAGFSADRLTFTITNDEHGNTSVEERIDLTITTPPSTALYRSLLARHDLATWREVLNLSEIRYHVSGAYSGIKNTRIRPVAPYWCNDFKGTCQATLFLDYDTYPITTNESLISTSAVFIAENFKPRTTRYTLNTYAITLGASEAGNIVLDRNTNLTIIIPANAKNLHIQPQPQVQEYPAGSPFKKYAWTNSVLPDFEFSYEYEETLESEVLGFFGSFQKSAQKSLLGPDGLAILTIFAVIGGSYIYLNFIVKKNKQ